MCNIIMPITFRLHVSHKHIDAFSFKLSFSKPMEPTSPRGKNKRRELLLITIYFGFPVTDAEVGIEHGGLWAPTNMHLPPVTHNITVTVEVVLEVAMGSCGAETCKDINDTLPG